MWTCFSDHSVIDSSLSTLQHETDTQDNISSSFPDLPSHPIGLIKPLLISGQWYVPMTDVLSNPHEVFLQCQQMQFTKLQPVARTIQKQRAEQTPIKTAPKPSRILPKQLPDGRFKWNYEESVIFSRIITAAGVRLAKPRDIEKFFPLQYNLTLGMIGSHIQKYKIKLLKLYHLNQIMDIQNYHYQGDLQDNLLEWIVAKWQSPEFEGFTDTEIMSFVQSDVKPNDT